MGEVSDFIQKQGAAVRLFEPADAASFGTGEGAAFVAEQLAFEEVFGNSGAIDGEKRAVGTGAVLTEGAGDEFLARPGFAQDEDGEVGAGDSPDLLAQGLHGSAFAD
jgi:hypothetical protein